MKRHPYILAVAIATLFAIAVWLCVPNEYTAVTKLSDEYKEVDLSVGLDKIASQIKAATGAENIGIDDMNVYTKLLKTDDFARFISQVQVPDKDMTYGEYLGVADTIEVIQDHLRYYCKSSEATLTISFTDGNAVIASQMLDSVTTRLQQIVTKTRQKRAETALQNAKRDTRFAVPALPWLLCFAAGAMAYVTGFELLPDTLRERPLSGTLLVLLGFALMTGMDVLLG